MLSIAMMGVCNETKIKDVFSMDEEGCVEDSLRHSVFAGIGVIGLLLLVLMVLVITVCCLACKLGRMKRYHSLRYVTCAVIIIHSCHAGKQE